MYPNDPIDPEPVVDAAATGEAAVDEAWVPTGADYASDRDFIDFPLSAETLKGVLELGYRTATPVQSVSIEPALAGRDLLVRAKTGTGKTAAFCVPIVERIAMGERQTRAIILAPTRELAQQIHEECSAIAKYRDIHVAVLVGGMPMGPQDRALAEGAAIVVGTPGRVLDHLRRGNLDLSQAIAATLDEADEMLSMGFYEDVTSILDKLPATVQILLFSATIGEQTEKIIGRYLKDPEHVTLSTDADQVDGIEHTLYEAPAGQHKVRSLLYLLDMEDPTSAIIFCNTREDAATVASFLDRQGLDVQLLSGELPQTRRMKVMKLVKAGVVRFLVATDVAARGIDISDLSHVVQYSLPQDPAIYLHRTGRTGRIGKKGTAIALIGASDLQTRRVLEDKHRIKFVPRAFPDPEVCVQRRVERQSARIRDAMGNIVFEAYLPTARALMQQAGGEALIAAALRAFFQWDRERRAAISGTEDREDPVEAGDPTPARPERRLLPEKRGGRSERGERSARPDREQRAKSRGGRRDERPMRRGTRPIDDFDSLLVAEDAAEPPFAPTLTEDGDLDDVLDVGGPDESGAEPEAADDGAKKKKRRRRKKRGEGGSSDLDAVLDAGDGGGDEASQPEGGGLDDIDSLLSMD